MKAIYKMWRWGLLVMLATVTGTAFGINQCIITNTTCSSWNCTVGSVNNPGTLSATNVAICLDGGVSVTVNGTTFNEGSKIQYCSDNCDDNWQNTANITYTAQYTWSPPLPPVFTNTGTFYYTNEVQGISQDPDCTQNTAVAIVGVLKVVVSTSAPTIITQPTNQTVAAGLTATFSVLATGCPAVNYQWYFNTNTILTGQTNSTLILPDVQLTNAGYYSVIVSNSQGNVRSSEALLTVFMASCDPVPAGIVAWWPGESNLDDIIGTNNGVVANGTVGYAPAEVGLGFDFNGGPNRLNVPDSPSLNFGSNVNFTIECWIRAFPTNVTTGVMSIVDKRYAPNSIQCQGYGVCLYNGQLNLRISQNPSGNGESWTGGPNLLDGQLHHIAISVVRDSTTGGNFYVDGTNVLQFDPTGVEGDLTTTQPFRIGNHPTSSYNSFFDGEIDELSLYNTALTSNQVAAIYQAGAVGKCASCYPAPTGIISWWPGQNNANDIIGTNSGILVNGVTFTNGIVGEAFHFNGSNQDVQIPYSTSLEPTNVTVECWVKLDSLTSSVSVSPGLQYIVFKQNSMSYDFEGYDLEKNRINGRDEFRFQVSSGGIQVPVDSITIPQPGVWYHLAGTYDGTTVKIYVNGVLEGSATAGFPLNYGTEPVYFGTTGESFDGRLYGALDEVSIYGRALGSNEIAGIFEAGSEGKCPETNNLYAFGPTNVITCEGSPAIFSVTAGGCSPITYQWEFGTNWISGQTGSSLVISNAYFENAGTYSVIVSSPCGSITNSATLTVLTNLMVAGPQNLSVCAGSTAVFDVTAMGSGPITYQWSFGTNLLTGQTNSTLAITNVGSGNVGTYSVVVSGACGPVIRNATLGILSVAVPGNQAIIYGQSATFSVFVSGDDSPTYQWQENGVNIPGATASTYTVVLPTVAQSGNRYDVIVSSPYCSLTSTPATLDVHPAPLLISADNKSRPYGVTNPPLTWTATGFVNGDTSAVLSGNPSLSCAAITNSPVGNYPIVITQGTLYAANYLLSVSNGTLMVTQAVLDVTALNETREYGATNPPFAWTVTGFIDGDTSNVLSGAPFLTTSANTNSPVGNYPIVITQGTLTCTNYSFAFSNGVLTVTQAPLTVSANNQYKTTGTPNPTLTGAITGILNNDNITATYSTTATTTSPAGSYPIIPALIDPTGKLSNYSVTTNDATLAIIDAAVFIQSEPPATVITNAGSTMSISVSANGTPPLLYQWYFNGTAIPGATGSTYTKVGVEPSDDGSYSVAVSNSRGTVNSSSCVLTVNVPPFIAVQPTNQIVAQGASATFTVLADGTVPLSYQWQSNGVNIAGATSSSYSTTNAGTYSAVITNIAGSVTSAGATLTLVGVSNITVYGSSPPVQGSTSVPVGTNITLIANPIPAGTPFPTTNPVWIVTSPSGVSSTNIGVSTVSIMNAAVGQYTITASCGNSSAQFLLSVIGMGDSNYDGIADDLEIGLTNPPQVELGTWLFDTPNWIGLQGQLPLSYTNLLLESGFSVGAVEINSNSGPAWLIYRESETNASYANVNLRNGTIRFQFKPDWSSTNDGGVGPLCDSWLLSVGKKGTTNGFWGLYMNPSGTNLLFCTETNSTTSTAVPLQTNVTSSIQFASTNWYEIALTFGQSNSTLYINGSPMATNGAGVTTWPNEITRSKGICVGNGSGGTNWCQGRIDNLETFNYPCTASQISYHYNHHNPPTGLTNTCALAPIAINFQYAQTLTNGQYFYITNGSSSGNFGWLNWNGLQSIGNELSDFDLVTNFVDAVNGTNRTLQVGSWIQGITGVKVGQVSTPLNNLEDNDTVFGVVLWDGYSTINSGNNFAFQAAGYANVQLIAYTFNGQNSWIEFQYDGTRTCESFTNNPPWTEIISPTNGQFFNAGNEIPITALASSDPDTTITNVAFLSGTNLLSITNFLGSDQTSWGITNSTNGIYPLTWLGAVHGTNYIETIATDYHGLTATSAPVHIVINNPPQISNLTNQLIIWPDDPTNVSLTATVTDDGLPYGTLSETWTLQASNNGPVTLVNATTASATAECATNGVYVFNLTATDGLASASSNCTVTIRQRPFVFVTSPTNNALIDASNAQVYVIAYDYDTSIPSNNIVLCDITNGVTNIVTGAYYDFSPQGSTNVWKFYWTNSVPPGTNTVFAIVTDNYGITNVSPPVTFIVYQPLSVSINPQNPTVCSNSEYDVITTVTGTGPYNYIWMQYTNIFTNQTTGTFVISNVTASGEYSVVVTNIYGSDSTYVNLQMEPALLANGPSNTSAYYNGAASFSTSISSGLGPYYYQWYSNSVLLAGQTASSLSLSSVTSNAVYSVVINNGTCASITNSATLTVLQPPVIYIVLPPNNAQETAFASLQLMSVVQDQAAVTDVVYSVNGVNFATNTVSPYTEMLNSLPGGTYKFRATAYDVGGRSAQSPFLTNVVIKTAPSVQIFEPLSTNTLVVGQNIIVGATATDSGGIITNVQFQVGNTLLGNVPGTSVVSNDLYFITWPNVPLTHPSTNIYAIAADNLGLTATSVVSVVSEQPCTTPGVSNVLLSTTDIIGGGLLTGTVILSNPATAGGQTITLSNSSQFISMPQFLYIPEGQLSNTFLISTLPPYYVTNCPIGAGYHQQSPVVATLTIEPQTGSGSGSDGSAVRPGFDTNIVVPIGGDGDHTTDPCCFSGEDGAVGPVPFGFQILYYGQSYSNVWVDMNGILTFVAPLFDYYSLELPIGEITATDGYFDTAGTPLPAIAPFWADVDPRGTYSEFGQTGVGTLRWGTNTVNGHSAFGATWDNVGGYGLGTDLTNRFQVVLIDRPDTGSGNFDVELNYGRVQWDTGTASLGHSARFGYGSGLGDGFELLGSGVNGALLDSNPTGLIHTNYNSPVLGRYVFQFRSTLAESSGQIVFVRDDQSRQSNSFSAMAPATGEESPALSQFNLDAIQGTVTNAQFFRGGSLAVASGSQFDFEFGVASASNTVSSFGQLFEGAEDLTATNYSVVWSLDPDFYPNIQTGFGGIYGLCLTNRITSVCGNSYTITDTPQSNWPWNKNILTISSVAVRQIAVGRCRDFVLDGVDAPENGTWEIRFREQIIASSGLQNGWNVEQDHTAFGGYTVTVPTNAVPDSGYEVRVIEPGWFTGQSAVFSVIPAGSDPAAPTLLPLELSTNIVNPPDVVSLIVSLDAPAPVGGAYVPVYTNGVPAYVVVIPAGQTTAAATNQSIDTQNPGSFQFFASYNGYRAATVQIVTNTCSDPGSVQNLQATARSSTILLQWDAVGDATGYDISRSSDGGNTFIPLFDGLTTTNYVDSDIEALTNYMYSVIALSNSCEGAASYATAQASYTAPAPAPSIIPFGGTYNDSVSVLITNFASGSTIFYATNGTTPTTSSASFGQGVNGGLITLSSSATVEAFSTNSFYYYPSPITSANFTILNPSPIDCGSNIASSLSSASSFSAAQGEGSYCAQYAFTNLAADLGQVVTLTASSTDFYPVLYVMDTSNNVLYADDSSILNGTNSQVVYQIANSGTNIFEVTSFFPWETGNFTLTMDCEAVAGLNVFTNAYPAFTTNSDVLPVGGSINFGVIPTNTFVTNYVTLTNSGTSDLIISNIAVYPSALSNGGNGFTINPSSLITIPAGSIANLAVSLFATNASIFSGYFIFNDNDGSSLAQNPFWANVSGDVGQNPGVPYVTIYYPTNGTTIPVTNGIITTVPLEIVAGVTDTNTISYVNFYTNNVQFFQISPGTSSGLYTTYWTNPPAGRQSIQVIAVDVRNNTGSNAVSINVGVPALTLTPTNPPVELLNSSLQITAALFNTTNGPVAYSNVVLTVTGANNYTLTGQTASDGEVMFTYEGTNAGADQITATATVAGVPVQAGPVIMNWATPMSCGDTYYGTLTNFSGFSMTDRFHYADYYSFSGSQGNVVQFQMNSSDFSTYMFIISNTTVLTNLTVEALNASNTLLTYTLPANGTYIVEATSSDYFKMGDYSLTYLCGPSPAPQLAAYFLGTNVPNYGVLNFSATYTNTPQTNILVLTNEGNAPLTISGWSLYYGLTNVFSLLNSPVTTLAAGASTNIAVEFMSTNSGEFVDALIFTNTDPYQNPFVVNLTAIANVNGTPPTVSITSPTNTAQFTAPANISIYANATANGSGVTITNVTFIFRTTQGAYVIGSTTSPVSGSSYTINWTVPVPGNYALQAAAYDSLGRISISQPVNITVNPSTLNQPPVSHFDYVTVLSDSVNDVLDVLTNDYSPSGNPLTITAIVPSTTPQPHGTATIVDNGKHIAYTPPPGYGSPDPSLIEDGFSYQISDGKGGTTLGGVYVSIFAAPLPQVLITNTPNQVDAGTDVPIVAYVTPNQYITNVVFYYGETLIGVVTNSPANADGFYTNYWPAYIVEPPCGCSFTAQATDIFGQVNTSPGFSIDVTNNPAGGGGGGQPTAYLDHYVGYNDTNMSGTLSPQSSLIQTPVVIQSGIFNVYGTATNDDGTSPVTWQLALYSSDGSTLVRNFLVQSNTPVAPGGFLATCDLTTIQNGSYQLRLDVFSEGYDSRSSVPISLESNLKLGEFSFSQQDLVIPVNGVPLTITRTYNSIDPNSADFGYGWTFSLNSMNVQLDETRQTVSLEPLSSGTANIRSGGGRDVTLTLPDGRTAVFNASLVPGGEAFTEGLAWSCVWSAPGVVDKLTTLAASGGDGDLGDNTLLDIPDLPNYWQDGGENSTIDNYDMPGWILTTPDQTQYYVTRGNGKTVTYQDPNNSGSYLNAKVYGTPKLTKIVQHSGDTIEITDNNITHYDPTGKATASIQFDRDTQGRIIAIHDPSNTNGFPAVKYDYDALGNLVHVGRLTDRNSGTYVTNTYNYTSSQFPHYITSVLNGDGTQIAQNFYDPNTGKLTETIDAEGNKTFFNSNPSNNTQIVVDRLSNTNLYVYDSRGNVLSQTDPLNETTTSAYDGNNNLTQTVDALGNTNTYQYDGSGNQTMAVDALNHTNLYMYDSASELTSQTDPLGNATVDSYDQYGDLTQSKQFDPSGNLINSSSSSFNNGLLAKTMDANGQTTGSFGYDPSSDYLTTATDSKGLTRTFGYDTDGNQTNSTYVWTAPDGSQTTVTNFTFYDAQNRVTMTIDSFGNTNQTFYDLNGNVSYTIDPYGNTNNFLYDSRGNQIAETNVTGTVIYTVYDSDSQPILTTDPNGITGTLKQYDAVGRVTNCIRLENVQVNLIPDTNAPGQMTTVIVSLGTGLSTNSTTYYANGWVHTKTSPDGTTIYTNWPNGHVEAETDPIGNTTTYAYDADGNRSLMWDANNHGTRFVYDAVGRMISTVYDNNSSVSNVFNNLGQKVGTIDQNGLLTQYSYNVAGQLTNVFKPQLPASSTGWSFEYNTNGQLIVTTDPNNHSTTNFYDRFGNQVAQGLPGGQTNAPAQYDAHGLLFKQYDFIGQMVEHRYDNFGRETNKAYFATGVTESSYAVSYAYDQLGQLTNVTQFYGSAANRFVAVLDPKGRGMPMSARLMASLNRYPNFFGGTTVLLMLGLAMAIIPTEKRRRFILVVGDEVTRLKLACRVAAQRGRTPRLRMPSLFWRFISPVALLAVILSEPGYYEFCTAQAQCDIPNNYSSPAVRITSFTYDIEGNLTQVNSPEGVINYGYDLATDRLIHVCTLNSEISYGYDADGRLQTVQVLKRNGATLITPETTAYTYDAVGNRSSVTLPNGVVTSYQYDDLNRLTKLTHTAQGGTVLASYAYQLDPTGRRTNAIEVLQQEGGTYQTNTLAWQYDAMYRLTNEISITTSSSPADLYAYTNSYTYDPVGNRLQKIHYGPTAETDTYNYNTDDELLSDAGGGGTTNYLYDANGSLTNVAAGGTTISSYGYDLANKLNGVFNAGGSQEAAYYYDDSGIRVESIEGTVTNNFLIDANNRSGSAQVLEELPGLGATPTMSYVIGDDVLAQSTGQSAPTVNYFLHDGHGNNRQLIGLNGSVSSHFTYDAYGTVQSSVSSSTAEYAAEYNNGAPNVTAKLFCGEQYDAKLQMYNLRARYYDSATGTFNQRDSFEGTNQDPQSLHKYLYAECDPVDGIDPSGHGWLKTLGYFAAGVVVGVVTAAVIAAVAPVVIGAAAGLLLTGLEAAGATAATIAAVDTGIAATATATTYALGLYSGLSYSYNMVVQYDYAKQTGDWNTFFFDLGTGVGAAGYGFKNWKWSADRKNKFVLNYDKSIGKVRNVVNWLATAPTKDAGRFVAGFVGACAWQRIAGPEDSTSGLFGLLTDTTISATVDAQYIDFDSDFGLFL